MDTSVYAQARRRSPAKASGDPLEVVFLGRLDEPRKGLDILLSALRQVHHDIRVTIMGGGRAREVEGVDFVGRVSDAEKAEILGRADVYVAPNTGGESFGIVLVEAMAAGAAVVASDLEAFRAVCNADSDEVAGALFRNEDSEDLARVLNEVLDDAEYRAQLVRNGVQRASTYDWDHVAAAVMQVYETVQDGTKVRVKR